MDCNVQEHFLKLFCGGRGNNNPEDAQPIVEDNFLLVADGLGGSGGFSHAQLKPEAMQADAFFDTVFSDIFSNLSEEDFARVKTYAETSLESYLALDYEAKTDRRCIYTSGYFASRLVSTLMFGYLLEIGKDGVAEIIEEFAQQADNYAELRRKNSERFTEMVRNRLVQVANNGNFVKETKNISKSMLLLPTTLVTMLYLERENHVDVVFLWAGDSRGYSWDKNGLLQITNDHETDGVMYNQINLSGGFYIECAYQRIAKPCMLFCTSDGCYTCMSAPLEFEYYFFDQFRQANSYEEATKLLIKLYEDNSQDDANTVAMRVFGYDSYDQLKADIAGRVDAIYEEYTGELPEIFITNFDVEKVTAKKKINLVAKNLNPEEHPWLASYLRGTLGRDSAEEIQAKCAERDQRMNACREQLTALAKTHYWSLVEYVVSHQIRADCYNAQDYQQYQKVQRDLELKKEIFEDTLDKIFEELKSGVEAAEKALSEMKNLIDPQPHKTPAINNLKLEVDWLVSVRSNKNKNNAKSSLKKEEIVLPLQQCPAEWVSGHCSEIAKLNKSLAKYRDQYAGEHPAYLKCIVELLINKDISTEAFADLDVVSQADQLVNEFVELGAMQIREAIEMQHKELAQQYWIKNRVEVLAELYADNPDAPFWQEFDQSFVTALANYCAACAAMKLRDQLYDRYNSYYFSKQEVVQNAQTV